MSFSRKPVPRSVSLFLAGGVFLLATTPLAARDMAFSGRVTGITDGDTIRVMRKGREVKVRLEGIDSPEKGQPFGRKAREYVSSLAFGKSVTVVEEGIDQYGRTLGEVILPDGRSLNEEMVRGGLAWRYKSSRDPRLKDLEEEARRAGRGLWADPRPVAPWEWRRKRG